YLTQFARRNGCTRGYLWSGVCRAETSGTYSPQVRPSIPTATISSCRHSYCWLRLFGCEGTPGLKPLMLAIGSVVGITAYGTLDPGRVRVSRLLRICYFRRPKRYVYEALTLEGKRMPTMRSLAITP